MRLAGLIRLEAMQVEAESTLCVDTLPAASRKLVLIRHSQPEVDPHVPASLWRLSADGRIRAASLAGKLGDYRSDAIWCSREPKAVETADIIGIESGLPARILDGLEEHHRDGVPFFADAKEFESAVETVFAAPDEIVMGTESARQALERFSAAIDELIEESSSDIIVVTHGTVMSLYVASVADLNPIHFWHKLQTPCLVSLDMTNRIVGRIESWE